MRTFVLAAGIALLGTGCVQTTMITRCYVLDNDPDNSRINIAYDDTLPEETYNGTMLGIPATLTITDAAGGDPMTIPGYWRDDSRFVYPTGDYFERLGNTIVGHTQSTTPEGVDGLIDGLIATETECR